MNLTNSIGLFMLMALALVMPSCTPEAKTVKDKSADQEYSDGGLTFTSPLALEVLAVNEAGPV